MKKVLIVTIAKDFKSLEPRCFESLEAQDYPNFSTLIHINKAKDYTDKIIERQVGVKGDFEMTKYTFNTYRNCVENRNIARTLALASDANYFFFVDADLIVPPHALSSLMLQTGEKKSTVDVALPNGEIITAGTKIPEKHIIGGWYNIGNRYVGGKWVKDNTLAFYRAVEPSLVTTDILGGCVLISREALSKIEFEHGLDLENDKYQICNDEVGQTLFLGEWGMFGNKAFELGYRMYLDGSVHCGHIKNNQIIY